MEHVLVPLFGRWLDEWQYEDIKDYQKVVAKAAEQTPGVKVTKMTKRPFGFHFTLGGCTYAMRVTTKSYSYQRIR
jgi:hypothetical protein